MLSVLEQQEAIESHVRSFFKDCPLDLFSWQLGGIQKSIPYFRVMRIKQGKKWIYISNGASAQTKGGTYGCEFILVSPQEDPLLTELLAMVAHYQTAPEHRYIDVGSTIDIGRPWLENSTCSHLLGSLPYPFGPSLEWLCIKSEVHVRFVWLVPITANEALYVSEHGVEALEELFEKSGIKYLDISRQSVLASS